TPLDFEAWLNTFFEDFWRRLESRARGQQTSNAMCGLQTQPYRRLLAHLKRKSMAPRPRRTRTR
ncbi:Hypothetical predicted protein, partial [Pelobates cultripes]